MLYNQDLIDELRAMALAGEKIPAMVERIEQHDSSLTRMMLYLLHAFFLRIHDVMKLHEWHHFMPDGKTDEQINEFFLPLIFANQHRWNAPEVQEIPVTVTKAPADEMTPSPTKRHTADDATA